MAIRSERSRPAPSIGDQHARHRRAVDLAPVGEVEVAPEPVPALPVDADPVPGIEVRVDVLPGAQRAAVQAVGVGSALDEDDRALGASTRAPDAPPLTGEQAGEVGGVDRGLEQSARSAGTAAGCGRPGRSSKPKYPSWRREYPKPNGPSSKAVSAQAVTRQLTRLLRWRSAWNTASTPICVWKVPSARTLAKAKLSVEHTSSSVRSPPAVGEDQEAVRPAGPRRRGHDLAVAQIRSTG